MLAMPSPRNCFSSDLKTVNGERVPDTTHTGSNITTWKNRCFPIQCIYVAIYLGGVSYGEHQRHRRNLKADVQRDLLSAFQKCEIDYRLLNQKQT